MITPIYKPLKKNGTTLYVLPSVAEDKNFETQNENYRMYLSHFVLVNFPKQSGNVFDFSTFSQNGGPAATFKDQLVESLRNYVANHESTIRNSKINSNTFFYDTFEAHTTSEKIFWKWAKSLNLIDFEPADAINDYFGADTKYTNNGPSGNTDHFREYLWTERKVLSYTVNTSAAPAIALSLPATYKWEDINGNQYDQTTPPTPSSGHQFATIVLNTSTNLKPNDYVLVNKTGLDFISYSSTESKLLVIGLTTTNILNDTIIVEVSNSVLLSDFNPIADLEFTNIYESFIKFISEIGGLNNVQLPDKSYSETFAYISHQHGKIPYALWNIKADNNYKPNLQFPILANEIQIEIQGGENVNNPLLTNSSLYPGSVFAQYDTAQYYNTKSGNVNKRNGLYYGISATSNINPTLKWPDFNGKNIDGLTLNLNINDYAQAVSYIYPIETFNEFAATSFNNTAPTDFEFNAILWYYTIEDVTGNNTITTTNLHSIEFLDTPENDVLFAKTKIPSIKKIVSNGYQDGNAYTFSLDTNLIIDSDTDVPSFDPEKIYSLFGFELYNEALTRLTYFNDQLTSFVTNNIALNKKINDLTGLIYSQTSIESIRNRMNNIENLLNVYSTLQIGESDTIIPFLDTSVNPPLLRLNSIDKQYGFIYNFNTKDIFTESENNNNLTKINKIPKTIPVVNGKDFLTIISNNDNSIPNPPYDTTIIQEKLELIIEKDLFFKQKLDIFVIPKINTDLSQYLTPFNDKKLELFINYNDGIDTNKIKLTEIALPVLTFFNGVTTKPEPSTKLSHNPSWKVRNVFYSKADANNRIFTFIVEDDLINTLDPFITQYARMFINNFIIQNNPAVPGLTYNLSDQFQVFDNPTFVNANIVDVEITNNGSGYTNGTYTQTGINIGNATIDISYNVNVSGNIDDVQLINSSGLITKFDIGPNIIITGGNNDASFNVIVKPITKINFAVNINKNSDMSNIFNNYDIATNVNTLAINTKVNIDKYFINMPELSFLLGYKINLTRISDDPNIPNTLINQRYNIKIEKL